MLSYAGVSAPEECSHDGIGRVKACCQIGHGNTHFDGWTVPVASDMHQAHFCFDHDIIACSGAIRASLAVTGDAGIDQAGIDPVNRLEIHLVFLQCVWEEILHQNITILDHIVKNFHP